MQYTCTCAVIIQIVKSEQFFGRLLMCVKGFLQIDVASNYHSWHTEPIIKTIKSNVQPLSSLKRSISVHVHQLVIHVFALLFVADVSQTIPTIYRTWLARLALSSRMLSCWSMLLPFHLAAVARVRYASVNRPSFNSHRGDSGRSIKHKKHSNHVPTTLTGLEGYAAFMYSANWVS